MNPYSPICRINFCVHWFCRWCLSLWFSKLQSHTCSYILEKYKIFVSYWPCNINVNERNDTWSKLLACFTKIHWTRVQPRLKLTRTGFIDSEWTSQKCDRLIEGGSAQHDLFQLLSFELQQKALAASTIQGDAPGMNSRPFSFWIILKI